MFSLYYYCSLMLAFDLFLFFFFFFNDTATTEIYTLSLHDALPISGREAAGGETISGPRTRGSKPSGTAGGADMSDGRRLCLSPRPYAIPPPGQGAEALFIMKI